MSYAYLASPYSDPSLQVREERFYAAMRATAWLLMQRIWVYSPIVHCHELAARYGLRFDAEYWKEYNEAMLKEATKFFILCIDGWDLSKEVTAERHFARANKIYAQFLIPIFETEQYEMVEV